MSEIQDPISLTSQYMAVVRAVEHKSKSSVCRSLSRKTSRQKDNDAQTLRTLSATNLDDSFCRACGYMASIPKLPPTLAILIAESALAIADTQRKRAIDKFNSVTAELLS